MRSAINEGEPVADEAPAVHSPIPGVFYRRPEPGAEPFVQEGDEVQPGTEIGLVEIMKQFHEVRAEQGGRIGGFLVDDEGVVAAGQAIVTLA
jgi:acetyl-CoA carboxylase biotin carboxyl carrier protein